MKRIAIAAAVACFAASALAQDKTRISFTVPASVTKYSVTIRIQRRRQSSLPPSAR